MKNAKWIWLHDEEAKDAHVQFYDEFVLRKNHAVIKVSCDTNYVLYVNGRFAATGQYSAYPDMRIYDEIDISRFVQTGKNVIALHVWYWGVNAMVYSAGKAGLYYEVKSNAEVVAVSDANTLCRLAPNYEQGRCKYINRQQGLTYCYNPNGEDGFGNIDFVPNGFVSAAEINISAQMYERPCEKLEIYKTKLATLINPEKRVYDLGCECAGVLHIKYRARKKHKFSICFGEYVNDEGNLLRYFDAHDYTLDYVGAGKVVEHIGYFRRIGCRYLQVLGDNIDVELIGIKEMLYPVKELPIVADSPRIKEIYDVSVRTLRLCMHEHYEDCPWREQVLYNMDSRNAMLYTYDVFNDFRFARSNLWLMQFAPKCNGFYPASFPSGQGCFSIIPLFNLIFVIQVKEYVCHSGDISFARELLVKLEDIIRNFLDKRIDGLISELEGCWNFIEWTDNMTGHEKNAGKRTPLVVNCFFLMALEAMNEIYHRLGLENNYDDVITFIRTTVRERFYSTEQGAFLSYLEEDHVCELGNAMAVISGCCGENTAEILEKLAEGKMQKASLAMKCFVYDALLIEGKKYHDVILKDILSDYGYMLDHGATSFWETLEGEKQYNGAGSLCHVWSVSPIRYFKILGVVKSNL